MICDTYVIDMLTFITDMLIKFIINVNIYLVL